VLAEDNRSPALIGKKKTKHDRQAKGIPLLDRIQGDQGSGGGSRLDRERGALRQTVWKEKGGGF